MSTKTKSYINELLNQLISNDDSMVYEALRKLDRVSDLFDHISESKFLTSLQGIPRKWGTNDAIVKLATTLLKKLVSVSNNNNTSLNPSLCTTQKTVSNLSFNQHGSFERQEFQRSSTQSEKNRRAHHDRLLSEQKHNFKSNHVNKDVNLDKTLHDSSTDKKPKSHSPNPPSKMSPSREATSYRQWCEDQASLASKQKGCSNPVKKDALDLHKKGVYKTVFSESAHNVSKYTLPHSDKMPYNLKSNATIESRKNCVGNRKEDLSQVSSWPDDNAEVNGVLDETHSKHPQKYTQKINGHNYLNNNQSRSSESSHFHSKKHSREPECNDRTSFYHKRKPSHADSNRIDKSKPGFRSPAKYNSHNNNNSPTKKNPFHPNSSQKQNTSTFRSPCRPEFPLSNHEDDSSKELSDENKHLMIDTAENCGDTSLDNNSKMTSPYSVQLKEGMFRTVKIGPEQEQLKVREIKHVGFGNLEDGAFSWGWSIERRGPSSASSSKEKIPSTTPKDANRCKRKIDYEKSDADKAPKKHQPSKDPQKCKQRDSASAKGRDIKSNSKEHLSVSREDKDLKSSLPNNVDHESNQKQFLNTSNEDKGSKKSVPHNQDHKSKQKEQSNVSSENKDLKKSFPSKKMPSSPVARKKTSSDTPTSDGNKPIPKQDCDKKSSKVIDDTTMNFMSSKRDRRSIYSGRKVAHEIPPLKLLCTEYLKKNILSIRISKSIPYEKLQPILEQCSPITLHKLEEQNKHLIKYTDKLWEKHCKAKFRDELNTEKDLWKNIYWKAHMKREEKLKNLTASISNGKTKANPERQAQWMGVDSQDPEKRRKKTRDETPPKIEVNGKGSASSFGHKTQESESPTSPKVYQKSQKNFKSTKKVAPLMSKTKKMLNMVNRRR